MKRIFFITLAVVLGSLCSLQAQKVKGKIVNIDNYPLEAVYVYNINSQSHSHTLENGSFII